jgi:hypothetical protein
MKGGRALSKAEFIERVASWAACHNETFDEGRLDEWMKQALIPRGDRGPNKGLRPTYVYGCRHYRRALQLVRFHSQGINDTDEIIVQLFIRGYGARPDAGVDGPWLDAVRKSLRKEFNKVRAKLNAQLRSKFADSKGEIPSGRKKQLLRQLGELDERFQKAGIAFSEDILISAVRAARSPVDPNPYKLLHANPTDFIFNSLFGGMLEISDDHKTEMERVILSSSDDEYETAKMIFKVIRIVLYALGSILEHSAAGMAFRTADLALSMRDLSALMLATTLKIAHTWGPID